MAVKTSLLQLSGIPKDSISVKRKFKTAGGDSNRVTRWWFVVRGSEEIIQQLESEWPKVQLQTAWKLQPLLFIPKTDPSPMSSNQSQSSPDKSPSGILALPQQASVSPSQPSPLLSTASSNPALSQDQPPTRQSMNLPSSACPHVPSPGVTECPSPLTSSDS